MPPLLSCLLSAIQNVFTEAMEQGRNLSTEFVDTLSTVRENFRDGILSLTYPLRCFIMASESTDSRDAGNCTRALLVSVWALFSLLILASLNKVSILARFQYNIPPFGGFNERLVVFGDYDTVLAQFFDSLVDAPAAKISDFAEIFRVAVYVLQNVTNCMYAGELQTMVSANGHVEVFQRQIVSVVGVMKLQQTDVCGVGMNESRGLLTDIGFIAGEDANKDFSIFMILRVWILVTLVMRGNTLAFFCKNILWFWLLFSLTYDIILL